jgi:hypothetical protein
MATKPGKYDDLKKTLPRAERERSAFQTEVDAKAEALRSSSIEDLRDEYRAARAAQDAHEAAARPLNVRARAAEQEIARRYDELPEDQRGPLYYLDGSRIQVSVGVSASVTDPAALVDWALAEQLKGLLSIHSGKLVALAAERLEEGQEIPPGVDLRTYPKVALYLKKS